MSKAIATRTANRIRAALGLFTVVGWTAGAVIVVSVIAGATIALGYGGSAAAAGNVPQVEKQQQTSPAIGGRWSGVYYGYGRRGGRSDCGPEGCKLTFDLVACKDGWCGIAVNADKSCGAVGLHLASDPAQSQPAFKGRLEVAKGAAPYTVEAWFNQDDGSPPHLHVLGDTGPELVLMRRSFPFETELTRDGDATCKLDKATS